MNTTDAPKLETLVDNWARICDQARSSKRHALVFLSEEPIAPFKERVIQRRWRVEPGLSDLPVYAVTTFADGGSCRPRALWIGEQPVFLSEAAPGLLVAQGGRVFVGEAGTEVCLSLAVRNAEYHSSSFRGAILLGEWSELTAGADSWYCQKGGHCQIPAGGGACPGCNYPRAYAHPSSLLDAFLVDQIYLGGTAIQVYPDPGISPRVVQVVQLDGRMDEYPIPQVSEDPMGEPPIICPSLETIDRRLLHTSSRQLRAGFDSPTEALDLPTQARLLAYAASLIQAEASERRGCSGNLSGSLHELALALAQGIVNLSHGYQGHLDVRSLLALEGLMKAEPPVFRQQQLMAGHPVMSEVRTILSELGSHGRAKRVRAGLVEERVLVNDRRLITPPWASYTATGQFLSTPSRIRIALLPGEADYVRIYDLRVTVPGDAMDYSVLDRVPGYGPEVVREGTPIQVDETRMSRYLPGALFAGRLREGASLDNLYSLSPSDLSGGVQIDLGSSLPPLSQIGLVYQVETGHLFCAIVEPL